MAAPLRRLIIALLGSSASATYTYAERHDKAECGSQSVNLGSLQTPALCAMVAGEAGCKSFMHSASYPVWGCRCCSDPDDGSSHNLWSVYDVLSCDDPGVQCVLPADVLTSGISAARAFCVDERASSSAAEYLASASVLHDLLATRDTLLETYPDFAEAMESSATDAAEVLSSLSSCTSTPSACNYGSVLHHQLRALLLLVDGHAARAFADSPPRQRLFDDHKILLADALYVEDEGMDALHAFFGQLPTHLMAEGVTYDAPFATMTIKDTFECTSTGDTTGQTLLGYTPRGFNVFMVR